MILNFIRAVLIILLIFVIIVDFNLPIIINTKTNQLFIAIIILIIILLVDEIIGFLIGLIFLIIYFKYYQKKIMPKREQLNDPLSPSPSSSSSSTSPFSSSPAFLSLSNAYENINNNINNYSNTNTNTNDNNNATINDPLASFFNFFKDDTKPKSYSTQPEIPDHYVKELKNENCTLIPYISNELLQSAQTNIYNEDNYKKEIKTDENYYGIQGLNSDNKHYMAFDNNYNYHNNL
jgi:hypothetical protein